MGEVVVPETPVDNHAQVMDQSSPQQMSHREDYSQLTSLIGQHYPFTPDNEKGGVHDELLLAMVHPRPEYSTIPNFTMADDFDQLNYTPVKINDGATPIKAETQEKIIHNEPISSLQSSQAIELREESEEVRIKNNHQEEMASETSSDIESERPEYQEQIQGTLMQMEDESKYLTTPICETISRADPCSNE